MPHRSSRWQNLCALPVSNFTATNLLQLPQSVCATFPSSKRSAPNPNFRLRKFTSTAARPLFYSTPRGMKRIPECSVALAASPTGKSHNEPPQNFRFSSPADSLQKTSLERSAPYDPSRSTSPVVSNPAPAKKIPPNSALFSPKSPAPTSYFRRNRRTLKNSQRGQRYFGFFPPQAHCSSALFSSDKLFIPFMTTATSLALLATNSYL